MASSSPVEAMTAPTRAKTVRRKASEACERCREKRIKCNGFQPCEQCTKKDVQCVFAFGPSTVGIGNEELLEKLDLVLSRLDKIEEEMYRQANVVADDPGQSSQPTILCQPSPQMNADGFTIAAKQPQYPLQRRSSGVAQLNHQTGCFEYYGQTSTFTIASSLGKRLRQLEDVPDNNPPATRRRNDVISEHQASREKSSRSLILDELPGFCDYVVPLNALRSDRYLHEKIADRHIDGFFHTIHVLLPILDPVAFKARYRSLRELFGDRRLSLPTLNDPTRPQFVCLMYAVLALGALYEDEREDSSSWASWYFAEAQDMLGHLLNASNLQLVQASTLLGAYAQHAIKPNLAYILNGLATRLAFSNGLNIESLHSSLGFDTQEARRTWWIIYIQEVELSLDSGRPMCLRSSEMNMNYPKAQLPSGSVTIPESSQVIFIPLLAEIAKIIRRIIELSAEFAEPAEQSTLKLEQREELRRELERWRVSLPNYLAFKDATQDGNDNDPLSSLHTWESRQQSSLQIHYYLAIIILLRASIPRKSSLRHVSSSRPLSQLHQSSYLNAARNMIRHIHKLLTSAPHLRRWTYYCFYCLQATLVILLKVSDDQHRSRRRERANSNDLTSTLPSIQHSSETIEEDRRLCNLAVEVFELIKLKASQRCADVVRHFLEKWRPEKTMNGSEGARYASSSLNKYGMQPVSSTTTASAPPLDHPADLNNESEGSCIFSDAAPARPSGTESHGSVDGSDSTAPQLSLSGLQAELHDALYSNLNDGFHFGQQQSFVGVEAFEDYTLGVGTDGIIGGGWPSCNGMTPGDNYHQPNSSL